MTAISFLGAAGLGLLLLSIGIFLGFSGSDLDDGGDFEGEAGAGVSLLSIAGIGSLLVGFGGLGYTAYSLQMPTLVSVPVGLLGAALCFRMTAGVKRWLVRSLGTGTSPRAADLISRPGTVTIAVPPGGGRGQVKVQVGHRWLYLSARTELDRELQVGEMVVLMSLDDGVYTVDLLQLEQA